MDKEILPDKDYTECTQSLARLKQLTGSNNQDKQLNATMKQLWGVINANAGLTALNNRIKNKVKTAAKQTEKKEYIKLDKTLKGIKDDFCAAQATALKAACVSCEQSNKQGFVSAVENIKLYQEEMHSKYAEEYMNIPDARKIILGIKKGVKQYIASYREQYGTKPVLHDQKNGKVLQPANNALN